MRTTSTKHQINTSVSERSYEKMMLVVNAEPWILSRSDFIRKSIQMNLLESYGIIVKNLIETCQRASITQSDLVSIFLENRKEYHINELRQIFLQHGIPYIKGEHIRRMLQRLIKKGIILKLGYRKVHNYSGNQHTKFKIVAFAAIYEFDNSWLGYYPRIFNAALYILDLLKLYSSRLFTIDEIEQLLKKEKVNIDYIELRDLINALKDKGLIKLRDQKISSVVFKKLENKTRGGLTRNIDVRVSKEFEAVLKDKFTENGDLRIFIRDSINKYLQEFAEHYSALKPNVISLKNIRVTKKMILKEIKPDETFTHSDIKNRLNTKKNILRTLNDMVGKDILAREILDNNIIFRRVSD